MNYGYPSEAEGGWWEQFDAEIAAIYAEKLLPYPNSPAAYRWGNRTAWDIGDGLSPEASKAKHVVELRVALGLPVAVGMASYGRPLLTGPFFATGRYGNFQTPGNVEVIVNGDDAQQRVTKRPVIADAMSVDGKLLSVETVEAGALVATFYGVAGSGSGNYWDVDELTEARAHEVPVLVYFDGTGSTPRRILALARANDWRGVMAYPLIGESTGDTIARVRRNVVAAAGRSLALIRPLYTRNQTWTEAQVLAIQEPLTQIIRETPAFVADLWFAWGRGSGVVDYPAFQRVATALAA